MTMQDDAGDAPEWQVRWNTEHEDDDLSDALMHPFVDTFGIALDRQGWMIVPKPELVAENEALGARVPRWPMEVPAPGIPYPLWAEKAKNSDAPLKQFLERRRKQ